MTDEQFELLKKRLVEDGDEQILDVLFVENYDYCVGKLQKEFRTGKNFCSSEDAHDVFIDMLLKFRGILLANPDKITNKNIRGYLYVMCRNEWLARLNRRDKTRKSEESFAEYPFPEINEFDYEEKRKAYEKAFAKLGKECKRMVQLFYIDRLSLKEIHPLMGYKNYTTTKQRRYNCFNNLKRLLNK